MDLSPYIEELLFSNDCVIIPRIGGFITNYTPASVDFIEQQVYPPKKSVSFNPKLVNNDGLLANHIVQKEHLTFKQASLKVDAFSQQIEDDLFNNRIIHFDAIGKLYFNSDSKLEFVPEKTNFLRDAYGLPNLECNPVLRNRDYLKKEIEKTATAASTNTTQTKPIAAKRKKKGAVLAFITLPRVAATAAVVLLLFASPYIYRNLFSDNNTTSIASNSDSTNTHSSKASILPTPSTNTDAQDSVEDIQEPAVVEDTVAIEVPEPEPTPVVDENAEAFVIVLGAFSKRKNADRLAKKLEKDNYLPDVTPKNGLSRVGVQITCTAEELKTHLKFLQDNYNKKAWVVE